MIIATDLEGVLIPEIWDAIASEYGIDELHLTTRDIPDFEELMEHRVNVLNREDLRLQDLQKVAQDVMAFPGSTEFLNWGRRRGQIMIISDTFHELSDPLVWEFGGYNLFANQFSTDSKGRITGYKLRIRGMKWRALEKLRDIGFFIVAIGDSHNDLSMLEEAHHPIFFNPPQELREKCSDFPVAETYDELRESILSVPAESIENP